MIRRYENSACEFDKSLLINDEYTFSVLIRSLDDPCTLTVTDEKSFIIMYTKAPYPVWVWTEDGIDEETLETVWKLCREDFPAEDGYKFNLKYETAEYFIRKGRDEGLSLGIGINMLAYDCPVPRAPERPAPGELYEARESDLETIVDFMEQFHSELNVDVETRESYREKAEEILSRQGMFFWKDAEGKLTAMCSFRASGDKASVNEVYTLPSERRKGYAENLVFGITKKITDLGLMPLLYTDADYEASNACYIKIGYRKRGSICTLEIK